MLLLYTFSWTSAYCGNNSYFSISAVKTIGFGRANLQAMTKRRLYSPPDGTHCQHPPAAPYGHLLPLHRRIYANAHVALLDRILTQAQGSSRSLASWRPTRDLPSRHAITIWHSIDYDVYLDTLDDLPERLPRRVGRHVLQQHSPPTRYASRPIRRRRRHLRTWVLLFGSHTHLRITPCPHGHYIGLGFRKFNACGRVLVTPAWRSEGPPTPRVI